MLQFRGFGKHATSVEYRLIDESRADPMMQLPTIFRWRIFIDGLQKLRLISN